MADIKNVYLDAKLHRRLKLVAVNTDVSVKDIVEQSILAYLPQIEESVQSEMAEQSKLRDWAAMKDAAKKVWNGETYRLTKRFPSREDTESWEKEYRSANPLPGQGVLFVEGEVEQGKKRGK